MTHVQQATEHAVSIYVDKINRVAFMTRTVRGIIQLIVYDVRITRRIHDWKYEIVIVQLFTVTKVTFL